MNNKNSNSEKSSTSIWVAVIGALAVVIAAYISKGGDKKEATPTVTPPVIINNTQNNNNNATPSTSSDTNDLPSIDVKADNKSKVYINNKGEQTIYEGK